MKHWIEEARAAGHEVLLEVPMEPIGYPANDPGPRPLLTSLSAEANAKRIADVLPLAEMAVGLTNHMGGRFLAVPEQAEKLLAVVAE